MKRLHKVAMMFFCLAMATFIVTYSNYREYDETQTNMEETKDEQEETKGSEIGESLSVITDITRNELIRQSGLIHQRIARLNYYNNQVEKIKQTIAMVELRKIEQLREERLAMEKAKKEKEEAERKDAELLKKKEEELPTISGSIPAEPTTATTVSGGDVVTLYNREDYGIEGKLYQDFSADDLDLFFRIVQAEIGDEHTFEQKVNVATVILNRVKSEHFPNNLGDVLRAKRQFSTYSSGRYKRVTVSDLTVLACEYAYEIGGSEVGNALFFDSNGVLKYTKVYNDNAHNFYIKKGWE